MTSRARFSVALILVSSLAGAAHGLNCAGETACGFYSCGTPASGVPAIEWTGLEPEDTGQLPNNRDTTNFNQHGTYGYGGSGCPSDVGVSGCQVENPYYQSVDSANGWIFTASNRGMEVWDARANQADPPRERIVPFLCCNISSIENIVNSEFKYVVNDLDLPVGDDTAAALAFRNDAGIVIYDTTNKGSMQLKYQSHGLSGEEVYAAEVNGTRYAFLAGINDQSAGLLVYDMDAALALGSFCKEEVPSTSCGSVYKGRLLWTSTQRNNAFHVDGAGDFVVVSSGAFEGGGFEIWNVSNLPAIPSSPAIHHLAGTPVNGVAMWQAGSTTYVGALVTRSGADDLEIYRCTNASCTGLATEATNLPGDGGGLLTYSSADGVPHLYVAGSGVCAPSGGPWEWLYDVSNPGSPDSLVTDSDYWAWYYPLNSTGFNFVGPRRAVFNDLAGSAGDYLYRVAHSIMDVHHLTAGTPPSPPDVTNVNATPTSPTVCQDVLFTATVSGTAPITLAWEVKDALGATVTTGGNVNPYTWSIAANQDPGAYTGNVTATNAVGMDTGTSQTVNVQALPALAFTGPGSAPTHDPFDFNSVQFHLSATGASRWRWEFGDGQTLDTTNPSLGQNPLHTYSGLGTYDATVNISNCVDLVGITSSPDTVTITAIDDTLVVETWDIDSTDPDVSCSFGFCTASTLVAIDFDLTYQGNPTSFEYDWDADGQVDEVSSTPVPRHTYLVDIISKKPTVTLVNGGGSVLGASTSRLTATGGTGTVPAAPSGLSATASGTTSIDLDWAENASDEDSIRVEATELGGAFAEVAFLPANTGSTTITNLLTDTTYEFRVFARNAVGDSAYSNTAEATTDALFVPEIFADGFESGDVSQWAPPEGLEAP